MVGGGSVQKNKAHKTRFSSKSQRTKHKIEKGEVYITSHPPELQEEYQDTMIDDVEYTFAESGGPAVSHRAPPQSNGTKAKSLRLNRNKTLRESKRAKVLESKRSQTGPAAPPRVMVLLALSESVNVDRLYSTLMSACKAAAGDDAFGAHAESAAASGMSEMVTGESEKWQQGGGGVGTTSLGGATTVALPKFKLRLTVLPVRAGDVRQCLEAIKVADIIAFAVPAVPPPGSSDSSHLDEWGKKVLTFIRAQGMPGGIGLVQGLADVAPKKRGEAKKSAGAAISAQFPDEMKSFGADSDEEWQQILRHLSEQRLSPPVWRAQRPYILAHEVAFVGSDTCPDVGTLLVSGYIRGRAICVNHLVHVASLGDRQLSQIDGPEDPCPLIKRQRKAVDVAMADADSAGGAVPILAHADASRDAIVVENSPDPLMGEQTWPTEEEMAAAGQERKTGKKVPKGTSSYQAAWYIGEEDEEEEEEEEGGDAAMRNEGGLREGGDGGEDGDGEVEEWEEVEDLKSRSGTSVWGEEAANRMEEDEAMTSAQREADRKRLKEAHKADQEFPDEVDTPLETHARQRFAKYRGLKSFRSSPWDPKEQLPVDYSRIFALDKPKRTQKSALARAAKVDSREVEGGVAVGTYIRLYLEGVTWAAADSLAEEAGRQPVVVCGLLNHETKMSVLHFGVKKSESYSETIACKEELSFHCGFRRFVSRPIFSSDDLNLDKHKLERFLNPGCFSIASVFAPILFGPLPLLLFKESGGQLQLAAAGSCRGVDPDRIILKRIVLSGYPLSVSKRKAVVKYMFHKPEDVRWFKPVDLWTKYGRRGRIREPIGDKGNMKCIFDGVVQQRDAVCLSLYKRVFPKWPTTA